ncbi:hypothetical protein C8Q75DRAFT_755521 [Abortiporus biennis]|nr:hypothetical protein C8Q75DRAFT_755521 [Abortiporus biennis]
MSIDPRRKTRNLPSRGLRSQQLDNAPTTVAATAVPASQSNSQREQHPSQRGRDKIVALPSHNEPIVARRNQEQMSLQGSSNDLRRTNAPKARSVTPPISSLLSQYGDVDDSSSDSEPVGMTLGHGVGQSNQTHPTESGIRATPSTAMHLKEGRRVDGVPKPQLAGASPKKFAVFSQPPQQRGDNLQTTRVAGSSRKVYISNSRTQATTSSGMNSEQLQMPMLQRQQADRRVDIQPMIQPAQPAPRRVAGPSEHRRRQVFGVLEDHRDEEILEDEDYSPSRRMGTENNGWAEREGMDAAAGEPVHQSISANLFARRAANGEQPQLHSSISPIASLPSPQTTRPQNPTLPSSSPIPDKSEDVENAQIVTPKNRVRRVALKKMHPLVMTKSMVDNKIRDLHLLLTTARDKMDSSQVAFLEVQEGRIAVEQRHVRRLKRDLRLVDGSNTWENSIEEEKEVDLENGKVRYYKSDYSGEDQPLSNTGSYESNATEGEDEGTEEGSSVSSVSVEK